ncbi:MAG TPA: hypothetical protein VHL58_11285 [Thermoanaerobaculia bacterium]|nr:hypothetical protein [Thermoanaerobaculia bacterium]
MFRKILAFLFLLLLAVGVWYSARWVEHREDLHATVVFDHPTKLHKSSPCRAGQLVIGRVRRVTALDGQTAVSIRIDRQYRNQLLSDSLFDEAGSGASAALEVNNSIAVGPPVRDGAVIHATDSRVTRWIATHGLQLGRSASNMVSRAREEDWSRDFEIWSKQVPEWKRQGSQVYGAKMAAARARVDAVELQLRNGRRDIEADRLRAQFNEWLEKVRTEK